MSMSKDSQFAFRVEAELREHFVQTCKGLDRPAGQVLREFMRQFIASHEQDVSALIRSTAQQAASEPNIRGKSQ